MKYDIIVAGAGASGLMAAYSAAKASGGALRICVLEKMPKAGRKIMITGKGRCNFTNIKDWQSFSAHIRAGAQFVRPAWRSLPPERVMDFFEKAGVPTVVERGDRAYPASYHSSDIVDALVRECQGMGVILQNDAEIASVRFLDSCSAVARNDSKVPSTQRIEDGVVMSTEAQRSGDISMFSITLADGTKHLCSKLIIATGGLSYPGTGSTGDGLRWASALGHTVTPLFPSLTALVPKGYKDTAPFGPNGHEHAPESGAAMGSSDFGPYEQELDPIAAQLGGAKRKHIPRETPLSEAGKQLCGISLKNVGATLLVQGTVAGDEFGDIDFTDGGIEGPIGFQLSRKAVKALINGSKVALSIDLKPGVDLTALTTRIKELWEEIAADPRSARLREKERCRVLLGKLMPRELIPAFTAAHPEIITLERRGRADTKVWVNLVSIAKALKEWRFDIAGYVGWERAVITAGGVSTDEIVPKTMESRLVPGLHFCGEAIDIDADTGGYNLQLAFCTGWLAGEAAART